jgi:hypothetical protein
MRPGDFIAGFVAFVCVVALAVVAVRVSAREPLVCRCEVEARQP